MPKDKHVGKILFVTIPGQTRRRWRWIVSKRPDGRYTAKAPKVGVAIRDLKKKRSADFGKEKLLPKGSLVQRGGAYPGMLVTAKPTTSKLDDPDAVPTVMSDRAFYEQVDAEGESDV